MNKVTAMGVVLVIMGLATIFIPLPAPVRAATSSTTVVTSVAPTQTTVIPVVVRSGTTTVTTTTTTLTGPGLLYIVGMGRSAQGGLSDPFLMNIQYNVESGSSERAIVYGEGETSRIERVPARVSVPAPGTYLVTGSVYGVSNMVSVTIGAGETKRVTFLYDFDSGTISSFGLIPSGLGSIPIQYLIIGLGVFFIVLGVVRRTQICSLIPLGGQHPQNT